MAFLLFHYSNNAFWVWLPRSCDLIALDYFLLGYVKIHKNKPQLIPELKYEIIRVIGEIEP